MKRVGSDGRTGARSVPGRRRFGEAREWEDGVLLWIINFWRNEQAQDLIEYSLLLAFVCLSGAAMFISMGQLTSSIWGIVNSRLAASNNAS